MIKRIISSFIGTSLLYSFPLLAKETTYKKTWTDNQGQHDVVLSIKENTHNEQQQVILSGNGSVNNREEWKIYDFVKDCPVDANITINPKSFEIIDLDKTNNSYLLFSYSISCRGGIDPEDVKYFAYQDGQKYTMKGEQTIIIGKDRFGGEKKLVLNSSLKNNLPLLKYMQEKWSAISTYNYNATNSSK